MGNSISSSGEEEIPAGNPASDAVLRDSHAPAAGSRASAAGDATKEEARASGNSSTSPAAANSGMGGEDTATSDAAKWDEEDPAAGSATSTSAAAASGEKKKKRMVRMTQAQVDLILAYTPTPTLLPTLLGLDHLPDRLRSTVTDAMIDAAQILQQSHESSIREQELVRRQMEVMGYVDFVIEVDDDGVEEEEGAEAMLPRRGRRRFRPGVRVAGGTVKRVN